METRSADQHQHLCLSCGLCCQGVLFSGVKLKGVEMEVLDGLSLPILDNGDAAILSQPCAAHVAGECTIYADRPSVCRSYKCDLYKKVLAGETTIDDALIIVRKAVGILDSLYDYMGSRNPTQMIWKQIDTFEQSSRETDGAEKCRQSHGVFLLNVGVLKHLCRKYFKPPWKNVDNEVAMAN